MKRYCLVCNKEFNVDLNAIKKGGGKYCSRQCFYISIKRPIIKCVVCNREFETSPSQIKRGRKFCSSKCNGIYSNKHKEIRCVMCGKEYACAAYMFKANNKGKFCSRKCFKEYVKKKIKRRKCLICGNKVKRTSNKYCSKECYAISMKINKREKQRNRDIWYIKNRFYSYKNVNQSLVDIKLHHIEAKRYLQNLNKGVI